MAEVQSNTRSRLTKTVVESIPARTTGHVIAWDRELKGFGVRVSPTGRRTYFVHRRLPSGRQCAVTIGRHGSPWTAEQARTKAKQLLGQIASGVDPAASRREAKAAEHARRAAPTMAELAARYEAQHLPTKRSRPAAEDRALIRSYILPLLGWGTKVAAVTKADIAALHHTITKAGKPVRANRALACASKMFSLAVEWGCREANPCQGAVRRNPEDHRERFLSPAELARLSDALTRHPEPVVAALIRFLILTGCRYSEAANATWSQFDLEAGIWTKPSAHTKQRKLHVVPLSAAVRTLLATRKREDGDGLVFPAPKTGRPLARIERPWKAIRRDAHLEGVRVHDLRHSFASVLASSGASLQLIGSLLGHVQISTTMKYAHLADDARREAVERVGALWQALSDGAKGDVVPLRSGGQG